MKIKPFLVEEWMNEYEEGARYNIAETCVDSVSADELFALTGEDRNSFLDALCARRLTYGSIFGAPEFKEGIAKLYQGITPAQIIPTHGAAGANHHVFYSLLEPGDRVISVSPTYQQLVSIPASFGADVHVLELRQENDYLPDLEELRRLAVPGTKMICINNPNNPTGALMKEEDLREIAAVADSVGAYVLCDEVYRGLTQEEKRQTSIVELTDKGISVSSMSKVFSLAGLRLGWIATKAPEVLHSCLSHRDYDLISCGIFDEALATVALRHADVLLQRNRGIVRENLSILDAWVQSETHMHYSKPQAGTTALLYYDFDLDSYEFCKRMYRETGAFVTPGDCFGVPHCVRIGYAADKTVLTDGLAAFSAFLKILEHEGTKTL